MSFLGERTPITSEDIAHGEARREERAGIVAWLRTYPPVIGLDEMTAWNVAAHIERGEHLK